MTRLNAGPSTAWLVGVALLALAPSAMADDLLAQAAGSWTGTGTARDDPSARAEAVRCRITNTYDERSGRLTVGGRCAAPGQTSRLDGRLEPGATAGGYRGQWTNPLGSGSVAVKGRRQGDGIRLTYTAGHPRTGEEVTGAMVWHIRGSVFTIRHFQVLGGRSDLLGEVVFRR